jgi:hypothetical protein
LKRFISLCSRPAGAAVLSWADAPQARAEVSMARRTVAAAILFWTFGAADSSAQGITVMECRPAFGASLGISSTGDRAAERTAPSRDAGASFELPVSPKWSARADFGTAMWTFEDRDPYGVLLGQESVRIDRLTLSAISHGMQPCGAPVRFFAGVGAGLYRYRFQAQRARTMTGGLHGTMGVEVQPAQAFAISAEIGIDAAGGPHRRPVFSEVLWMIRGTVSAKVLF